MSNTNSSKGERQPPPTAYLMLEGAAASCGAAVVSNPFEVMKTRLQLQGELQQRGAYKVQYRGTLHAMFSVAKNEGIFAIQKGLGASFVHQCILNGLRLGLYRPVADQCARITNTAPNSVPTNFLAGFFCGGLGAMFSSPIFLAKTRLQSQVDKAHHPNAAIVGEQHNYRGLVHALSSIYASHGVARGLFHGVENAIVRTSFGSAVQLSTYDGVKRAISEQLGLDNGNIWLHFASAAAGGFLVAVIMNPFDVVMTRCYNTDGHNYDGNMFKSLFRIAKVEGFGGMYKGVFALWSRIGPHTICTFLLLEQLKMMRHQVTNYA